MLEFTNKVVLVTGASQGIGLGIATCFLESGATVHITGTRASAADYDDDLSSFVYHQAQLSNSKGCQSLHAAVPQVDVLINNAGVGMPNEFDMQQFRDTFEVNLFSAMELCMLYQECLAERKGSVINVGSLASHLAIKEAPAYTASKSAIYGMTRALADKWAPTGVRVNMVAPGFIETRMTSGIHSDEGRRKKFENVIPMLRLGDAKEIGYPAVFLASEKATYITGISLPIDGGLLLR